jgi:hypothetical protein
MLSFKIAGQNGIPREEYRSILYDLGFIDESGACVSYYLYTQDKDTPSDYKTQCLLKSVVDSKSISNVADKSLLSKLMGKYMAKEYRLAECLRRGRVVVDDVILFKPVGPMAFGGYGIIIATKGTTVLLDPRLKYVACQYIRDVMTFKERKFHLRVYLFVSTWGRCELYPKYRIITADLPYKKEDWNNKAIHDTHLASTDADYIFAPDGDLYIERTDNQIKYICKKLVSHIKATPYPESKAGYEMLGLDFLVKSSGKAVLLEVNNNAGIKCVSDWNDYKKGVLDLEMSFAKEYFDL